MGRTHLSVGFLASLTALPLLNPAHPIIFVVLGTIAGLLPDIDHHGSTINRLIPITRWLSHLFKHRGFFHSIFPPLLIYFGGVHFGLAEFAVPVVVGYMSHLLSDGFTKMGVNLLHPVSNLHLSGFLETGGAMELIVFGGVLVLSSLELWWLFF